MTFGSETTETFRTRYRLRDGCGESASVYLDEGPLILTADVRASP